MTYKTKGLPFFITGARNIYHAAASFIYYRIGVTENDIEEYRGEIPEDAQVMEAV